MLCYRPTSNIDIHHRMLSNLNNHSLSFGLVYTTDSVVQISWSDQDRP